MLHDLGEQSDKVAGAEVGTIDAFFFQMTVQVGQQHRDQSIESVEIKLEDLQLCVKQSTQLEDVDYMAHNVECQSFISQEQIEEASDEVHSLAVV